VTNDFCLEYTSSPLETIRRISSCVIKGLSLYNADIRFPDNSSSVAAFQVCSQHYKLKTCTSLCCYSLANQKALLKSTFWIKYYLIERDCSLFEKYVIEIKTYDWNWNNDVIYRMSVQWKVEIISFVARMRVLYVNFRIFLKIYESLWA
jgi:hypothetical protein